MRYVRLVVLGVLAGLFLGFLAGLLRRQAASIPHSVRADPRSYAGGYVAPTPSEDHTVAHQKRVTGAG
jgi:hypothetical protein